MAKFDKKGRALKYRKQGWALSRIATALEISKSTASIWCRDMPLSPIVIKRLLRQANDGRMKGRLMGAQTNKRRRAQRVANAEEWARAEIGSLSSRDLLMLGIGLYWGEGSKARKLTFTNSSPRILLCIKAWFERILGVSPEEFVVRIYVNVSHQDRYDIIQQFWQRTLELPATQFRKPAFIQTSLRKVYENRETYYGVVALRIRKSGDLQNKILGLIQATDTAGVAQW